MNIILSKGIEYTIVSNEDYEQGEYGNLEHCGF